MLATLAQEISDASIRFLITQTGVMGGAIVLITGCVIVVNKYAISPALNLMLPIVTAIKSAASANEAAANAGKDAAVANERAAHAWKECSDSFCRRT